MKTNIYLSNILKTIFLSPLIVGTFQIFVSMLSISYLTIKLNSSDATDKNLPGHYCPWYKKPMAGQWGKWLMKSRIKLRIGCLIPTFPSWSKWHELRGIRRWDEGREPGRCTMSSHAVKRKRTKKGYIIKRQDILLTLLHIKCCSQCHYLSTGMAHNAPPPIADARVIPCHLGAFHVLEMLIKTFFLFSLLLGIFKGLCSLSPRICMLM